MKTTLFLLAFLLPFCGSSQDISDTWFWYAGSGEAQMSFTLKAEGSEFTGHHCAVFENGDRIDCVEEDGPASIRIKKTAENEFEGSIRSGYSNSKGKIKLVFDREAKTLLFEILEPPGDIYYLPKKAIFTSTVVKKKDDSAFTSKGIPEEEIKINGKIGYATTSRQLLGVFGDPINVEEEYLEMSDEKVKKYSYPGADLFFAEDNLKSFKIFSPEWFLETKKLKLKVGSSINTLSTHYPEAYSRKKNGNLAIPIGTGDYIFLLIEYNLENLITAIEQRTF